MRRERAWMGHGRRMTPCRSPMRDPGASGRVRRAGNWRGGVIAGYESRGWLCALPPMRKERAWMGHGRRMTPCRSPMRDPGASGRVRRAGNWRGGEIAGYESRGWLCALPPMRKERAWMGHGRWVTRCRFVLSQVPNTGPGAPGISAHGAKTVRAARFTCRRWCSWRVRSRGRAVPCRV